MEGRVTQIHSYSANRCEPFCSHYGICGGCKWQILPYEDQIRYKQKQVLNNLTRIGKVELPEISPILPSEETIFYRNKLEFTFSNKRWLTYEQVASKTTFDNMNALGFHIPGMFDKVFFGQYAVRKSNGTGTGFQTAGDLSVMFDQAATEEGLGGGFLRVMTGGIQALF